MFGIIGQRCQDYYDEIPDNTFSTMAKSAVFSFTITLISQGSLGKSCHQSAIIDFTNPLKAAVIGVLAAAIHALLTPIFNAAFGDNDQLTFYRETLKEIIVFSLTMASVNYATSQKVTFVTNRYFSMVSTNLLKSSLYAVDNLIDYFDPQANGTQLMRNRLRPWGLDTPNGANTTYIVSIK